jgi:hypothetical protein
MNKRAFDKIRAGLDSARTFLGGSADKSVYHVQVPDTLDKMGPDIASVPERPAGRSTMGKPGMHGGFKPQRRG